MILLHEKFWDYYCVILCIELEVCVCVKGVHMYWISAECTRRLWCKCTNESASSADLGHYAIGCVRQPHHLTYNICACFEGLCWFNLFFFYLNILLVFGLGLILKHNFFVCLEIQAFFHVLSASVGGVFLLSHVVYKCANCTGEDALQCLESRWSDFVESTEWMT